jgi:hypothetical protein
VKQPQRGEKNAGKKRGLLHICAPTYGLLSYLLVVIGKKWQYSVAPCQGGRMSWQRNRPKCGQPIFWPNWIGTYVTFSVEKFSPKMWRIMSFSRKFSKWVLAQGAKISPNLVTLLRMKLSYANIPVLVLRSNVPLKVTKVSKAR